MSKKILAINREVVHKICSGQVVLNLATAIKELVENSLDAKATAIEIRLKEYGSDLIEVSDNGSGIHPDNFAALTLKHYTSKINDFSDLVNVETYGFRGEALSSLCALAKVTVITRHQTEQCGSKLDFDSTGLLLNNQPCPRQVGTTLQLSNLFFSLPVRQKEFHRNLKREFSKAVHLLSAYCLICTSIKIMCINQTKNGGRTVFLSTQGNKTIRENISCIFGPKQLTNLIEIIHEDPHEDILSEFGVNNSCSNLYNVNGFISNCEHGSGRSNTDRQFYYINSRPCEPSKVMKLVNEIYHQYNQRQFPFVLLNISVPKHSIDINVTPDKRLIFVENEKLLLAVIKSSLRKLFENIPATYTINKLPSTLFNDNSSPEKNRTSQTNILSNFKHTNLKCIKETISANKRVSKEHSNHLVCKQQKITDSFSKCEEITIRNDVISKNISYDHEKSSEKDEQSRPLNNRTTHSNLITSDFQIRDMDSNLCNDVVVINTTILATKSHVNKTDNLYTNFGSDTFVDEKKSSINVTECSEEQCFSNLSEEEYSSNLPEENLKKLNLSCIPQITNNELNFISTHCANETEASQNNLELSCNNEQNLDDVQNYQMEKCNIMFEEENKKESNINFITEIYDTVPSVNVFSDRKSIVVDICLEDIKSHYEKKRIQKNKENNICNKFHAEISPTSNELAENELKKEITKDMFCKMKIIGQFNLGFIITKLDQDLFIVDQHATDEKYNYEMLQRTTVLRSQKLVIPQELDLTITNEYILMDNIDIIQKNGFEFFIDETAEPTKRVKLLSIPVSHNWQFGKEDIDEMLFMLHDAPHTLCRPSRIRSMFASRACRKSVMIGTALTFSDMKRLITHMSEIEQPWNCPHGRPTMRHLINLLLLK